MTDILASLLVHHFIVTTPVYKGCLFHLNCCLPSSSSEINKRMCIGGGGGGGGVE